MPSQLLRLRWNAPDGSTPPTRTTPTDADHVRRLLHRRAEAVRTGDADRLVADYLPDAVTFTPDPPLRRTGPQVRDPEAVRAWFSGFATTLECDVRDLDVTASDGVAFAHSLNRVTAVPRGGTEPVDLWFRSTVCLRRVDGQWRIAHEHTSVPTHPDGDPRPTATPTP